MRIQVVAMRATAVMKRYVYATPQLMFSTAQWGERASFGRVFSHRHRMQYARGGSNRASGLRLIELLVQALHQCIEAALADDRLK